MTAEATDQEQRFNAAMVKVYERARDEAGYNATRFLQMLSERGGLGTAHVLLNGPTVSDGFTALWKAGRLDLTVEAQIPQPEFAGLFSEAERGIARERLRELGYQQLQ